jgi:hypothetical protein
MRGLALRIRSHGLQPPPRLPPPAALISSGGRVASGAAFCLSGLGIAAAATIAAFFGIGLSLLVQHPARLVRSEPPSTARRPPMSAIADATTARVGPMRQGGGEPLQQKAGEASARPAPASMAPASVASPPEPTPKADANSVPAVPTPVSRPNAAQPQPAAHGAAALPIPVLQPKPYPAGSIPPPPAASPPRAEASPAPPAANGSVAAAEQAVNAAELKALLAQGDAAFRRGDLTSARLFYQRAFEAGEGRGALGIGASYDPFFLRRFHLWAQHPDPDEARAWYLRARDLGVSEAERRLARPGIKPQTRPTH